MNNRNQLLILQFADQLSADLVKSELVEFSSDDLTYHLDENHTYPALLLELQSQIIFEKARSKIESMHIDIGNIMYVDSSRAVFLVFTDGNWHLDFMGMFVSDPDATEEYMKNSLGNKFVLRA